MKWHKIFLFILVLPLTLFLDFILYAFLGSCPSCSSFAQFVGSQGALSFPIVEKVISWMRRYL